jgi:hypothetical protein
MHIFKREELGLDEASQADPVHRLEHNTNHSVESETGDATLPKRSVAPKCVPKPFNPVPAYDTSVQNVLVYQRFQGSVTDTHPIV